MNKKVIISALVILFLMILGIIAAVLFKKGKQTSSNVLPSGNTTVQSSQTAESKSIAELLTSGQSQKCTYSYLIDGQNMQGSVYIDSGKIRADVDFSSSEIKGVSHMIVEDKTIYSWMDGTKTGFKMSFDPQATPAANTKSEQSIDPTKKMDYKCSPWSADQKMFSLPSDVTFSDFSGVGAVSSPTTTGGNDQKCAACNYLSGDNKTQCLTALGCSK